MLPSCVSFRDKALLTDERRIAYKDWTELETYIHIAAAKDAIRQKMDDFEPYLKDGLPFAKELYRVGAMSKHSVDMCDAAQFANIPSYVHQNAGFFTCMFRTLDNSFEYWHLLLKILRAHPELDEPTNALVNRYEELLKEMDVENNRKFPPLSKLEGATAIFVELCHDFESLWSEMKQTLRDNFVTPEQIQSVKSHLHYTFLDIRDKVDELQTLDEIFEVIESRIDMINTSILEWTCNDLQLMDLHYKFVKFSRKRAIKFARVTMLDFIRLMRTDPTFHHMKFQGNYQGKPMKLMVNWHTTKTPAFRYFWLADVVLPLLNRHHFLYEIDLQEGKVVFYLTSPEWIYPSLTKVIRDRINALRHNGVVFASVCNEILLLREDWDLTMNDVYDYMSSIIRVARGDVDNVLDTLDGLKPRKEWQHKHMDKKYCELDNLLDDYPLAVPWVPQTLSMNEFFHYYEGNHMWFSPPFYTHMRGFKFGLCVFPRGKGTGKDTHMSVGVCLMAGEHDDLLTFPPKGKIHVKLVNQIGNHGHICGVYQFQGVNDKSIIGPVDNGADYARLALSIDQFVPISQLDHNPETNTQFLIENKLYFTVSQTEFPHQRI